MSGGQTGAPGQPARGGGFGPPANVLQNVMGRAGQYGRPQGYQQFGAPQMGAPSGWQGALPQGLMQQAGPLLGALGLNPPGLDSTGVMPGAGPGIQNTGGQQLGAPEGAAVMPGAGPGIQNNPMQKPVQMGVPQMGGAAVQPSGVGIAAPAQTPEIYRPQQQLQQRMGQFSQFNPLAQFLKGR
jgi:hypothetical protein